MKLKSTVSIVVLLMVALFGALSVALAITTDLLDSQSQQLARAGESIRVAQSIKNRILAHNRNTFLFNATNDPSRFESLATLADEVGALLREADVLVNNPAERRVLDEVERSWDTYLSRLHELQDTPGASAATYNLISSEADTAIAVVDRLTAVNRAQMEELSAAIRLRNREANLVAGGLFAAGAVILGGIAFGVFRFIAQPLVRLSGVMTHYAQSGTAAPVDARGIAEIANLAGNFNALTQRLEERRKDQLRFIASIVHDLRNPLGAMSITTGLLLGQPPGPGRRMLEVLARQMKFLERLVGDLLDTTHIESGHLRLQLAEQDVGMLVVDAVELLRPVSSVHQFKLELGDGLFCICDGARISQVLNNLLGNAVKYSPNGGLVTVTARRDASCVSIAVTDQGIGIDPVDVDNIFRPFQRSRATKGTIPGIGLGLSASRRIVEAHGGTLEVSSTPGKGATFQLRLPLTGPALSGS